MLSLFETKTEFSLTETQYKEKTGVALPKDASYLLKNSAVSKLAAEKGYSLLVNERTVSFKKNK